MKRQAGNETAADLEPVRELGRRVGYCGIESFSGPGGMSLGLERAGFKIPLAFDVDEWAVKTHCRNLGNRCFVGDASKLSGNDLLGRIGKKQGDVSLFSGGPPCQGFSKQKRDAHLGDSRNDRILDYIRLVQEIQPRFFIFENVAIFGQKRGRAYIQEMLSQFTDYTIYPKIYNSVEYGLAQTRQRYIAVGRRNDQLATFRHPRPTVSKHKTVGEVLDGLPEPPEDYSHHPQYPNHQRARVTAINIKRFSYVPQGGGWQSIPEELRLECHKNVSTSSGGWPDVYGRLEWGGQCPTITGGFDSFTRGRYGHPLRDRPLTPREAARLQGFPDSFLFLGTRADIRSQIGNAVPPPLAEAVGLEIMRSLLCADGLLEDSKERGHPVQKLLF